MIGSFNGLSLNTIVSIKDETDLFGRKLSSVRLLAFPQPELEQRLVLNSTVRFTLSSQEIEGRLLRYTADADRGYEITIERTKREPDAAHE